jgi:hypothetical protein
MTSLGIMTHRILSTSRFSHYAEEAARLGFHSTLLFTPHDIDFEARTVVAYRYRNRVWSKRTCKYPTVAHDMGFYSKPRTIRRARTFKQSSGVPFTGYALGHKWAIHAHLLQTKFASYMPETELMQAPAAALAMARRHRSVMVKPKNGKQGRGIVKLTFLGQAVAKPYVWKEGDLPASELTARQAASMLRRRFRLDEALVQRWMDIRDPSGGVFDIRALVQKDGEGHWQLTGMAVRQSGLGHITSNVSGGGSVREVAPFLAGMYCEAAERITAECRHIAAGLPEALEAQYGKPFIELGIDLAVERGGGVRIIEVNIKPGKKIVRALSGEKAYADALLLPIRYAKQLSDRRGFPSKGL